MKRPLACDKHQINKGGGVAKAPRKMDWATHKVAYGVWRPGQRVSHNSQSRRLFAFAATSGGVSRTIAAEVRTAWERDLDPSRVAAGGDFNTQWHEFTLH